MLNDQFNSINDPTEYTFELLGDAAFEDKGLDNYHIDIYHGDASGSKIESQRELWINSNSSKYYGSYFIHLGILLESLKSLNQIKVIK